MATFTKNDIINYIFGGDFEDDRLEELENDMSFMLSVIKTTRDKKMINICNDEFLGNLAFVRELINIFSFDKSFCFEIASKFKELNKNDNDILCLDAILVNRFGKMFGLLDEELISSKMNLNFNFTCDTVYFSNLISNKAYFDLFSRRYCDYPEIVFNFAKKLVEDILNSISLTDINVLLHNNFKSIDDYKKYGNKKIIYFLLAGRDVPLANYYLEHPEIASVFEKDLNYKLSTWENYKYEQFAAINEMIFDYLKEIDFWVSSDECYKYIASKFNMPEFLEYVRDFFEDSELSIIEKEPEEDHTEYLLELERRVRLYLQTGNVEQYLYTGKQKSIDDDKL